MWLQLIWRLGCVRVLIGGRDAPELAGVRMGAKKRDSVFAAFSCVHAPHHNPVAVERAIAAIPRGCTDLVCLGDLFDGHAASVHPDEAKHTLFDEYESAAGVLEQFRAAVPKTCNLFWLLGNHEANTQAPDKRRIPRGLRDSIHWNNSPWCDVFQRWSQTDYQCPSRHNRMAGTVQLGQVIFTHGFKTQDMAEAHSVWEASDFHPHRLIVRGHTHRPMCVTQRTIGKQLVLPLWSANAGTLVQLSPPPNYMMRKDTNRWGPAVVRGTCRVNTPSRFASRQWEAETVMLDG